MITKVIAYIFLTLLCLYVIFTVVDLIRKRISARKSSIEKSTEDNHSDNNIKGDER